MTFKKAASAVFLHIFPSRPPPPPPTPDPYFVKNLKSSQNYGLGPGFGKKNFTGSSDRQDAESRNRVCKAGKNLCQFKKTVHMLLV
jgi:hypothetical protein